MLAEQLVNMPRTFSRHGPVSNRSVVCGHERLTSTALSCSYHVDTDSNMPESDLTNSNVAFEAVACSRRLMRTAWTGALATLARADGHPYGSLVATATAVDGGPLLLLSRLAEHTRNLEQDNRASLLLDGTTAGPEALSGSRLTLVGRLHPTSGRSARWRYLARHPGAGTYIDFADFALYRLDVQRAHLVAGFGRIAYVDGAGLLLPAAQAERLALAEPAIVDHMNEGHADAIALMAHRLGHAAAGHWRMVGCDPEGIDLASDNEAVRLTFPGLVRTADEVRQALIAMVKQARAFG